MKKFIIKVHEWCVFFVEGTMQDLESKLRSMGITMQDSCSCSYKNHGVLFDTCINTKTLCEGYDPDATQKALSDVQKYLTESFDEKFSKEIFNLCGFREAFSNYFKNIPHYSNIVKILVESDEKYQPRPNECISPRKYKEINSIDEEYFWDCMWQFASLIKPEL